MYIPNEKQILAHCAEEQFLGYGGGMGSGKTRWLCEMAKYLSVRFSGNFGLLARQSGPALTASTMEVFFNETLIQGSKEWRQLGCHFSSSNGYLEFRALNPVSKIWFTGLDSDNIERIKSLNLGWFGIDEATEVSESIYNMLCTRLRRNKAVPEARFRKGMVSANPEAGWLKKRFIDQKLPNHRFIQAVYKDNPHLPEDYQNLFVSMPESWKQKYLLGNWGAVAGIIYPDFRKERHIIPYKPLPPEWRFFRGMDHGQQNPCAVVGFGYGYSDDFELREYLGMERIEQMDKNFDDYPVIIAYKLYYSPGLVLDHKRGIANRFADVEKVGPTYADPSIWAKDRQKMLSDGKAVEYSIADEYLEQPYSLRGLTRANNRVSAGLIRVAQLLRIGHLYFMDHPSMEPLIGDAGEIMSYSWKNPKSDDDDWPEEPLKRNDHACDAVRYGVMSLPPPKPKRTNVIPFNSFAAVRKRAIEYHKKRAH